MVKCLFSEKVLSKTCKGINGTCCCLSVLTILHSYGSKSQHPEIMTANKIFVGFSVANVCLFPYVLIVVSNKQAEASFGGTA